MTFQPYQYTTTTDKKNNNLKFALIVSTNVLVITLLIFLKAVQIAEVRKTQAMSSEQVVLGATQTRQLPMADIVNIILPVTPTLIPPPVQEEIVQEKTAHKPEYTIAIIGDSMEDTMGPYADYFEHLIKKKYPTTKFNILNYGKGSQTVEEAYNVLDNSFNYQTRNYKPIAEEKPDIIIVGSFAYNPYFPYDRNRHWITLTRMVEKLETIAPHVYMLAEIAPLRDDFGKGLHGVNYDTATAYTHSGHIIEQLQNTVGLSRTLRVPLINAFEASISGSHNEGNRAYIDPSDNIHPSIAGHEFMAEKMVEAIRLE